MQLQSDFYFFNRHFLCSIFLYLYLEVLAFTRRLVSFINKNHIYEICIVTIVVKIARSLFLKNEGRACAQRYRLEVLATEGGT